MRMFLMRDVINWQSYFDNKHIFDRKIGKLWNNIGHVPIRTEDLNNSLRCSVDLKKLIMTITYLGFESYFSKLNKKVSYANRKLATTKNEKEKNRANVHCHWRILDQKPLYDVTKNFLFLSSGRFPNTGFVRWRSRPRWRRSSHSSSSTRILSYHGNSVKIWQHSRKVWTVMIIIARAKLRFNRTIFIRMTLHWNETFVSCVTFKRM